MNNIPFLDQFDPDHQIHHSEAMEEASFRDQINARFTCHAWEISEQLRKVAHHFPKSRVNILGYSSRLEAISTSLLSLFPILTALPKRDIIIAQHHLGTCHRVLKTLYGLQELLGICAGNSELQPVVLVSGKCLILPSEDAHSYFWQALGSMEESIRRAIYSMRESFKCEGELSSSLEVLFEWMAASLQAPSIHLGAKVLVSPQDCIVFAYEELAVPTDATSSAKEGRLPSRTNVTDLPGIRALQVKPVLVPISSPVLRYFPDLRSLSWTDNCGGRGFVLPHWKRLDPDDTSQQVSFFERLLEQQSECQASFAETLIDYDWNQETQRSAGRLVLHDILMTSYNHGRIKEREVLLFQNRLLFLRKKDDLKVVIWDISLWTDVILVAYNPRCHLRRAKKDTGYLTVYWKTEVAGIPRVSGVNIYFEKRSSLELWAAFLSLDHRPPKPANPSNDISTSNNIHTISLAPEDAQIEDVVSISKQETTTGKKGVIKNIWNATSLSKKWGRKQGAQT